MRWSCLLIASVVWWPSKAGAQEAPAVPDALAPLPWQLSKAFPIDADNPEARIPTAKQRDRNPLEYGYFLQDLIEGAEQARRAGDHAAVVGYYRAVVKAVPDRAKG